MIGPVLLRFLSPDGDEARQWALDELRKAKYFEPGPTLIERLGAWLLDRLESININLGTSPTLAGSITIIILVLVLVLAGLIYGRLRPGSPRHRPGQAIILDDTRTTERLLKDAKQSASAGNYGRACVDYYRACIRILDERGLIVATPGMTAVEAAWQGYAATRLPLSPAAQVFDSVLYGSGEATVADADSVARLVDKCRTAGRVPA